MNGNKSELIRKIIAYLPSDISNALLSLGNESIEKLCEIRLKSEMPVILIFTDRQYYITKTGRVTSFLCSDLIVTDNKTVSDIFTLLCGFSVYSYTEQINNGFITLPEGVRVGVYGTALTENSKVCSVRNIRGLNIRIPAVFTGCSGRIADLYIDKKTPNIVICGPPSSGKTTVLKDLCRTLSDRFSRRVSVIDERFEFISEYTGINTDVLSGYPKDHGIEISVRTLSPEIIMLDEIGMNGETEKIIECMNCGVSFIMSMHCTDKTDLYRKSQFVKLVESGAVDYCIFLENKSIVREIIPVEVILNEGNCIGSFEPLSCSDRNVFLEIAKETS